MEEKYKPETVSHENVQAETERKITSPEEAAKMTAQRRKDFGLPEAKELTPEQSKELEESIKNLLEELDKYNMDDFDQDVQEDWYYVKMEATAGKDREIAKVNLEQFLQSLQGLKNI